MAILQDLTFFQDDDVTPLLGTVDGTGFITQASCSTDPSHPRPYLKMVSQVYDAEVKLLEGSANIGTCSVEILDKAADGNQAHGWFTALLADGSNTQILMRRTVLRQKDEGATAFRTIFDGVCVDPELLDNFVTYRISLRTIRERERKNPIFQHALTTSVLPPGVTTGYGTIKGTTTQIVKPVGWEYGFFRRDPNWGTASKFSGRIDLKDADRYSRQWWSDWTDQNSENLIQIGMPQAVFDPDTAGYLEVRYPNVQIQWKPRGAASPIKTVTAIPQFTGQRFDNSNIFIVTDRGLKGASVKGHGNAISYITLASHASADLPAANQEVDFRVISNMKPTDKMKMYIETPFFQLLKDIYDGKYSYDPNNAVKIRYNAAAMSALISTSTMARLILEEPVDDMFSWVSEHIYKPMLMAPAENENGEIVPISIELPAGTDTLDQLNDTNVSKATWTHTKDDAITSIFFSYKRDLVLPPGESNTSLGALLTGRIFDYSWDVERLVSLDVQFRRIFGTQILFGDKPFTAAPDTLRSVTTNVSGLPMSGDVSDEDGAQVAQGRAFKLIDRFSQGAQRVTATCLQTDSVVKNLKLGQWVQVSISWLPDYKTGLRGINRLMQVIGSKKTDPVTRQVILSDAGPWAQPVALPSIGTITLVNGSIVVPVTALPVDVGSFVRVEYAINNTVPATNSPLWSFLARRNTLGADQTPAIPVGNTVWVRARGEKPGTRASAWTNPVSINVPILPAIHNVIVEVDKDGVPKISWEQNTQVQGIKINYLIDSADPDPDDVLSSTYQLQSTPLIATLPVTMANGDFIQVEVIPYSGWTGSAVSGTAGLVVGRFIGTFIIGTGGGGDTIINNIDNSTTNITNQVTYPIPREIRTKTGTVGTLQLVIYDPQHRLTKVQFKRESGNTLIADWTDTAASGGTYTTTVPLTDKQISTISYRIYGTDEEGVVRILVERSIQYGVGDKPLPPVIKYVISQATGIITLTINGDSDTNRVYATVRTDRAPSAAEILAGYANTPPSRIGNFVGPALRTGQQFFIGAMGVSTTGTNSDIALLDRTYLGIGFTPDAECVIAASPIIGADKVTWKITVDEDTQELWVYVQNQATNPAGIPFIENKVPVYRRLDVGRDIVAGVPLSISFPLTGAGHTQILECIPYNALGVAGVPVVAKAVGLGSSAPPKPTKPVVTLVSRNSTQIVANVQVTVAGGHIFFYMDGVLKANVATTAAVGAQQTMPTLTGLTPSTTYTLTAVIEGANGVQSDVSTGLQVLTDAVVGGGGGGGGTVPDGSIPLPSLSISPWSYDDQGAYFSIIPTTLTPAGVTWHMQSAVTTGSFPNTGEILSTTSLTGFLSQPQGGFPRHTYYRVWGTKTNWNKSGYSNVAEIFMPGGYPE